MMYRYSDGETVDVAADALPTLLEKNRACLRNYQELWDDMDDPSYVARGNGFCDTKYSEDFLASQMEKYRQRIADVERWLVAEQVEKGNLKSSNSSL